MLFIFSMLIQVNASVENVFIDSDDLFDWLVTVTLLLTRIIDD